MMKRSWSYLRLSWALLLMIAASRLLMGPLVMAQCTLTTVDSTNDVEITVCLDWSTLDGWASVDSWANSDWNNWPNGDPYVVDLGVELQISDDSNGTDFDSGMVEGGSAGGSSSTATPGANYTASGTAYECYDPTGTGSSNCSWQAAGGADSPSYQMPGLPTPTLSLTTSATPALVGQPVAFTATISDGPTTGTLTFNDTTSNGTSTIGTSTIAGTTAIFSTETLAVGNHSITAYWAGDSNTSAATSNAVAQATLPLYTAQLAITPSSLTGITGTVGASFVHVFQATGGTQPYTWSIVTGTSLPPGLTLSPSGEISGTPTTGGAFTFSVLVTDNSNPTQFASASPTITITQASSLVIVTSVLPSGYVGSTYNTTETSPVSYLEVLLATGGTPAYTWSITSGSLPPGLSLTPSTGVISGVPSTVGTYTIGLTVQDNGNGNAQQTYSAPPMAIAIAQSPLVATSAVGLPYGSVGIAYSQALQVTGGTPPYTWSIASGSLPPGLSLVSSTGVIFGTPYQGGNFPFAATVSDSGSPVQTQPIAVSLAINAIALPALGDTNTIAGGGSGSYGGPATNSWLNNPQGVAADSAGNFYIADYGDNRVLKVTATTGIISVVAGTGTSGYYGDTGLAINAELRSPMGVAVDSVGNLYIADSGNDVVRKVTASGIITTVAGQETTQCTVYYYSQGTPSNNYDPNCGDGGPATSAQLYYPVSVAVDVAGSLYIADYADHRIRKVTFSTSLINNQLVTTGTINTVAGSGNTPGYSGDGGSATSAQLNYPDGVAVDSAGNIYIADTNNNRIREVTPLNGVMVINTLAGNGTQCQHITCGDGGQATSAQLNSPLSMAVDAAGDVFFSDFYDDRIREVTASTGVISTVDGNGSSGYSGDGGVAANSELNNPDGVAVDPIGNLYVADSGNGRIRVVSEPPVSTTVEYPAYQIVSILYAAPGNKSQVGYTTSTTSGITTSVSDSISDTSQVSFGGSVDAWGAGGGVTGTLGFVKTSMHGSSASETLTDAIGWLNPSLTGAPNAINHNQDEFVIWMDPQILIAPNGSSSWSYSVAAQTFNGAHFIQVYGTQMEADPISGLTTIDLGKLWPQQNANGPDTPGLASICRNLITAEYLNKSCTTGDQCGCQPSDFMPILATNPLLGYDGTTNPMNANTAGDTRYTLISPPLNMTLDTSGETGNQNDNKSSTETVGGSTAESVGITFKEGWLGVTWTQTNTVTWTQSHSYGSITGSANVMNVNLLSTTPGCTQNVSLYEDTTYHTFVFQLAPPDSPPLCP